MYTYICIYVYVYYIYTHAKSLKSCLTLCDPMDYSPPGSSVHGILQARILEWVALSFSLYVYIYIKLSIRQEHVTHSFFFFCNGS